MKPVGGSSEWQPAPAFLQRIYSGYSAERKYRNVQQPWGENLVRACYKEIPLKKVSSLTQRALDAALNTFRRSRDPKPGLLKRMIQDQATVYYCQQGDMFKDLHEQYQAIAKRYLLKYMGLLNKGGLSIDQEAVCEGATNTFLLKIRHPEFVLESALPTYLIGILKRQMYSSYHPKAPQPVFLPEKAKTRYMSAAAISYFQFAHRTIAKYIGQLDIDCQTIILDHYGIDKAKVDAVSAMPVTEQPLSDAEFRERFAIAMEPSKEQGSLKTTAVKLGIDPRQISREHQKCLDKLVLNVSTKLFSESSIALPDSLKDVLQTRIDKAWERQKRR